jgi:hypothetical protein
MSRMLRVGLSLALATLALGAVPSSAAAGDVQRLDYQVGPLQITPGQNRIAYRAVTEKPPVDGWIVGIKPNLVYADGTVPKTNLVMFHHGVWLNLSGSDSTSPGVPERFFATGEEKTRLRMPPGFGYRYEASDTWLLNHMVHNLTSQPMELYVTYEIDFIPAGSPAAEGMRPVRPIWMDVVNGSIYPVFDVFRGSGGGDGRFTYPADAENPYSSGVARNLWQVDRDGVLVSTAGHVHTGGLTTDLWMRRTGARYAGPDCGDRKTAAQRRRCRRRAPSVRGNRAHLFRSVAKYWEPRGPVSWDVSMTATPANWRVAVKKGDILEVSTTYETKLASWYESMGIMVVYMADGGGGKNPYRAKVDRRGRVTHGHLPENNVHGGGPANMADARRLPSGAVLGGPISIDDFGYAAGDLRQSAPYNRPPTVKRGRSLTFELSDADASKEIWHSITSCAPPCNRATGIAYPIPDGRIRFDSGQLGDVTPAVGRRTWQTPKNLPAGTYTYFCRIHPSMRGAFRVTK